MNTESLNTESLNTELIDTELIDTESTPGTTGHHTTETPNARS
jgi:hypothetical protein